MRSLVKKQAGPGLWLENRAIPEPGPDDVRIRVSKAAICGTDLHIYNWDDWSAENVPVGIITGHEYVGVIDKIGDNVETFEVGTRVSGEGHIACGTCRNCRAGREHLCGNTIGVGVQRDGAFAEYVVIPAHNAYQIPDSIPDDLAAIFDPLGNAVHTALSFDLIGEDVLITGAGPIGLMATAIARHVGGRNIVVTDLHDDRLALARKLGATRTVRADQENLADVMGDLGMTEGFDVGLEMSGQPAALNDMTGAMIPGGRIALLGLPARPAPVDLSRIVLKGLNLKGIYGREMFETWYKMVAMLESGLNVDPVITHRLPFSDYETGFELLNRGEAAKIILDLQS